MTDDVREHYRRNASREWARLVRDPYHRLEFDTTMHFLEKHLPRKGLVLDAGGGPGRYTIELAKRGYDVVLFDLTPALLQQAKRKIKKEGVEDAVEDVVCGSVDDLSMFEDGTFDAVLCLGGPLSHLQRREKRRRAVGELVRVAKRRAPLFVSVIGRLALCMNSVVFLWPEMLDAPHIYRRYTTTGEYKGGYGFTACHFYLPEELQDEFSGITTQICMVGLEGMFSTHAKEYNKARRAGKFDKILWETHLATCTHPSIVGISEHFMLVCRRR